MVLVTGVGGFIGAAVAQRLLGAGENVVGIDNLNDYYSVRLKEYRLEPLLSHPGFRFLRADIADHDAMQQLAKEIPGVPIVHLAAQAGVRHSINEPRKYVTSNLVGFANIAELARQIESPHLVYASTSSVYGLKSSLPFSETDPTRHPLNLYAASKIANEAIAHAYSHLFDLPTSGLRFFTVYGPAGRPDMSPLIFARKIMRREPVQLFDGGRGIRDYTYIDDIVNGIVLVLSQPSGGVDGFDSSSPAAHESVAPFRVFNVGSGNPIRVSQYLEMLGEALGRKPVIEKLSPQSGDMDATHADTTALRKVTGWTPSTSLAEGTSLLAEWCLRHEHLLTV